MIRPRLPEMAYLVEHYCLAMRQKPDPEMLAGNCHSVSIFLKKMLHGLLVLKVKRGHWHGGSVRKPGDSCPTQHSWLEYVMPVGAYSAYIDPTQWVFTGKLPEITIASEADDRYDPGSYRVREMYIGAREMPPRVEKDKIPSGLRYDAQIKLAARYDATRDWAFWTKREACDIANDHPGRLQPFTREIYDALIRCKWKALIPFLSYEEIYRDGNNE